jgi:hypothetical protein
VVVPCVAVEEFRVGVGGTRRKVRESVSGIV